MAGYEGGEPGDDLRNHLQALPELCLGELVGDLVALIGTLDVALEEADR